MQSGAMIAEWAGSITAEDLSKEAASLLAFAAYHGSEAEVLADAEANPERYATPGPTRSTSIVACFPAFTDLSGESMGAFYHPPPRECSMSPSRSKLSAATNEDIGAKIMIK